MNKDEILEKSRKEHKNQDSYEKEVSRFAGAGGTIAAVIACLILTCVDIFLHQDTNGVQAIMMATLAGECLAKGIKTKRRWEIVLGIFCVFVAVFSLVVHIVVLAL